MLPFVDRSILKAVSLFALSVQDKVILLDDTEVAVRLVGAAGAEAGVGVGVGVDVIVDPATRETSFEGGPSTEPWL